MSGLQSKVGRAGEGRDRDERYYRLVLSRYCCKSTALFRPMPLSYFENKIEYALPYGKVIGKRYFCTFPFLITQHQEKSLLVRTEWFNRLKYPSIVYMETQRILS